MISLLQQPFSLYWLLLWIFRPDRMIRKRAGAYSQQTKQILDTCVPYRALKISKLETVLVAQALSCVLSLQVSSSSTVSLLLAKKEFSLGR